MINENSTLKQMARESLKGKWNIVVPTFLVYFLIIGGIEYLGEIVPILNLLTLGIGLLWLVPYVNVSYVKFYDGIKEINASK